jgi:hypothetical protein
MMQPQRRESRISLFLQDAKTAFRRMAFHSPGHESRFSREVILGGKWLMRQPIKTSTTLGHRNEMEQSEGPEQPYNTILVNRAIRG